VNEFYGRDLAYIHDVGFGDFARRAAPWLLRSIHSSGPGRKLVVDLGCGSGIWAERLLAAGFDVVGVDISAHMVRLAKRRAGRARFVHGSVFRTRLPLCDEVTAISECIGYAADRTAGETQVAKLFCRVFAALRPGGLFVFDIAVAGRVGYEVVGCRLGKDWLTVVRARERRQTITREIIAFRRVGRRWRRSEETHRLRLYRPAWIVRTLRNQGFRVRTIRGYGQLRFAKGWLGFVARKPRIVRS